MVDSRFYQDPFRDSSGNPRRLRGAAILSGSSKVAEMAGRLGFDTVWLEMEHGGGTFSEIETLCMAAEAGGAVPTVRLPNHHRENVLKALEIGAKIVVVPMVNDAETAQELVQHGKFPPLGQRGFNTRSRGLNYGLDGMPNLMDVFAATNANTHLIAQIETALAAANIEAICRVEGLSGVLVGPGDLSASLGKPGAFTDPEVIEAAVRVIRTARELGKHAGILVAPGPMLDAVLDAGCDLYFCAGDINDLARTWRTVLTETR
ncbi:MAG: 2-keto-3-deoxy-L-rhamnonate aldolase [Armatimonadaceae bacterium]